MGMRTGERVTGTAVVQGVLKSCTNANRFLNSLPYLLPKSDIGVDSPDPSSDKITSQIKWTLGLTPQNLQAAL